MPDETTTNTNPAPVEPIQTGTAPRQNLEIPNLSEQAIPSEPTPQAQEAPSLAPTTSAPPEMPPEAPEAPRNEDISKSSDIPENTAVNKDEAEKTPTALESPIPTAPTTAEASVNQQTPTTEPVIIKEEPKVIETVIASTATDRLRALFAKAREVIQFRKRKKLDRILTLFLKKSQITNDDVEKLLHISDATAGRYLSILEKEGKIKRHGKTGQSVTYSRI